MAKHVQAQLASRAVQRMSIFILAELAVFFSIFGAFLKVMLQGSVFANILGAPFGVAALVSTACEDTDAHGTTDLMDVLRRAEPIFWRSFAGLRRPSERGGMGGQQSEGKKKTIQRP